MKTILAAAAVLALSISVPALAQQPNWSQPGDYYAPSKTGDERPTSQELNQAKEGDYYAPGKTIVEQPTAQESQQNRQGDYYAPRQK
jgi:hypothetical protein